MLNVFGKHRPIADFIADIGKLRLMYFVGLGIDLALGGERLIDGRILDVVFVLILVTSTIGPIMTQHYAPQMLAASDTRLHRKSA